mgnify:CR=1 FL=1|tara:strand:- start:1363 stop:2247 length:885 start_codon:yes stop_codon:yes gene_type:complete
MDPIPNIGINASGIPLIPIQGIGIPAVVTQNVFISDIRNVDVNETRTWLMNPPQAIPIDVPVTVLAGTPIVDVPGCVTVHKENAKKDPSKNKNLVNDDPKQNVTLCDGGMPYYQPPDYDYRELYWQTINTEPDEVDEGVEATEADPIDAPAPPPPPPTDGETAGEVECPPLNARRIGDLNTAGTEKVKEYKLTVDGLRCETIWEPVPMMEQYLPSIPTIATTATIATVATTSALLAKPLADLILKVVKPVIKKTIAKVKKMLGQKEKILSKRERLLAQKEKNQAVKAARTLKGQ